jgi:hypothetical protein
VKTMAVYWQPNATLIIRQGPDVGQQFSITGMEATVGRHKGCDIQIDEPEVSRKHARITWSGTGYVVEDLRSANGTFVDGERVTEPRALKDGDLLRLGNHVELAFQVAAPIPSDERPTEMADAVEPPSGEPVPPPAHGPPLEPVPARAKGFPWVVVVIGVLILLCLCLVLAAGGGYLWFSQGG